MYSVSRINMPTNLRELLSLHTTFHFWIDMFFLCTVYIVHQLGATKYIMYVYWRSETTFLLFERAMRKTTL